MAAHTIDADDVQFLIRVCRVFMIDLSGKEHSTLIVSNDMLQCFPFDDFTIHVHKGLTETSFTLDHISCGVH
jgi:hypothetical protein